MCGATELRTAIASRAVFTLGSTALTDAGMEKSDNILALWGQPFSVGEKVKTALSSRFQIRSITSNRSTEEFSGRSYRHRALCERPLQRSCLR